VNHGIVLVAKLTLVVVLLDDGFPDLVVHVSLPVHQATVMENHHRPVFGHELRDVDERLLMVHLHFDDQPLEDDVPDLCGTHTCLDRHRSGLRAHKDLIPHVRKALLNGSEVRGLSRVRATCDDEAMNGMGHGTLLRRNDP